MTELSVNISKTVNAPIERVFDAWLDPAMLTQFILPAPGMAQPEVETDARDGGRCGFVVARSRVARREEHELALAEQLENGRGRVAVAEALGYPDLVPRGGVQRDEADVLAERGHDEHAVLEHC